MSKNKKLDQMKNYHENSKEKNITTNQGVNVSEDNFTLRASDRGPSLLQDFHFQEKLRHFDRERIPERVVHARGTGAHGIFEVENSMKDYTSAKFLQEKGSITPVFIRFSTVQGFRGSPDTVRDARGMAIKFYTEDGNYDIPGISFPVFFIQDAIKFPDFIHAVKPEPDTEVPQGQTAHDSFWDFVSTNEEAMHSVMWAMSDRGIPRSYRTMEGFGVHSFKWINEKNEVYFVKYHFTPQLGVHSLVWDEAQKIAGKDPDFHRKDLYEAIENNNYPKWDMFVQILEEKDEFIFDFDILDPTKLWPEEIVPKTKVGTITLNKNVDNFFAETEQVAFSPANLVPGITFSNDPLLQGRIFSYADAHVYRLGGPNFEQIPINMPLNKVNNNQRDGFFTTHVNTNKVNYTNNARNDNNPSPNKESGYHHDYYSYDGHVNYGRPDKFLDYFTQPKLYFNSLSKIEQQHLIEAVKFELSKVKSNAVRQNVINTFDKIDTTISKELSKYFNLPIEDKEIVNDDIGNIKKDYSYEGKSVEKSNLSIIDNKASLETFKIAVLIDNLDVGISDESKK
ncbi:MAG TPA: catalase, partial [Tissierellaceae bacterium]